MDHNLESVAIRPGRPEDAAAVFAFCLDTFEWGDYVDRVWAEWLGDADGRLLVAVAGNVPVGIVHVARLDGDEAWLEGLRVDPAVRRRGIGMALTKAALDFCRTSGIRVVRLFTSSANQPALALLGNLGGRAIAEFVYLTSEPAGGLWSPPETAVPADQGEGWRLWRDSDTCRLTDGLYCVGWRCLELTKKRLADHLTRGEARVVRRAGRPGALALPAILGHAGNLHVGSICGSREAVRELAHRLRAYAGLLGAASVGILTPRMPDLIEPLAAAGYAGHEDGHLAGISLFAIDVSNP